MLEIKEVCSQTKSYNDLPKWLKKDEQTGKWHVDGNAGVCEVFDFIINLVMGEDQNEHN